MSNFGCHVLYFPTGESFPFRIVEINDKGFYHTSFPMSGERPAVVWLGGVCILLPEDMVPQPDCSIYDCLQHLPSNAGNCSLRLWKAEGLPVDADVHQKVKTWLPVF